MVVARWVLGVALGCGALSLSGCGGPKAPPKSVASDISVVETALSSARSADAAGKLDRAMEEYNSARSTIERIKPMAVIVTEKSKIKNLEDDLRKERTALELKIAARPKSLDKKAGPAVADAEDPGVAKRKADEAAKAKKDAAEKADRDALAAQLNMNLAATSKKKGSADESEEGAPKEQAKKTAGEEAAEKEPEVPAIAPKEGPFPAVTDSSPLVQIVKLDAKKDYAIAYIQIFNKGDKGRRIMNVLGFFKDGDNQIVLEGGSNVAFTFKGFKADAAKIVEDQMGHIGITSGSHAVDANQVMRVVVVGEGDKAQFVKKFAVRVVYDDGRQEAEFGTAAPTPMGKSTGIKGL